eukprot:TRINITY_DN8008_c2_g1_i1.p1 TRINITY_DN8008_c2_g1~~TRINITY_DN8008_c2_g1_i1.p1  ORF type:complete len:391 (+),score=99.70 TRINITY_DN8008_c2_g1_i1:37-1173(+)
MAKDGGSPQRAVPHDINDFLRQSDDLPPVAEAKPSVLQMVLGLRGPFLLVLAALSTAAVVMARSDCEFGGGSVCFEYQRNPAVDYFHLLSPLHVKVPGVIDVVLVWEPGQVATYMDDPTLLRMASYPPEQLPGPNFRRFWERSVWGSAKHGWWSGFQDLPNTTRVKEIRDLLDADLEHWETGAVTEGFRTGSREDATAALARILAARLLPANVSYADALLACDVLSHPDQGKPAGASERAKAAHDRLFASPAVAGDPDNFYAVSQSCHALLHVAEQAWRQWKKPDSAALLFDSPPATVVPRWVPQSTWLGGRLWLPAGEHSVMLLFTGYASWITQDERLMFAQTTGRPCPAGRFVTRLADQLLGESAGARGLMRMHEV